MTQEIRDKAKALGIKSWHVKAIDKLQEEIAALEVSPQEVLPSKNSSEIDAKELAKELGAKVTIVDAYGIGLIGGTNSYVRTKNKTYGQVLDEFKKMGV